MGLGGVLLRKKKKRTIKNLFSIFQQFFLFTQNECDSGLKVFWGGYCFSERKKKFQTKKAVQVTMSNKIRCHTEVSFAMHHHYSRTALCHHQLITATHKSKKHLYFQSVNPSDLD